MGSKTTVWIFHVINKQNITWETVDMAKKKVHLKRGTESFLKAVQNNALRTNYVKVKRDKKKQNSKWMFCSDRDETVNHIIKECSKLVKIEYKTRQNWVEKVIHWELWKKF